MVLFLANWCVHKIEAIKYALSSEIKIILWHVKSTFKTNRGNNPATQFALQ